MRQSQVFIPTQKDTPANAEVASHQLMLRAGLLRQVASGIYNWLPVGLRVMQKVEAIIREELNRSGAQEVLMPVVQPAELWRESGRWDKMGPELLRLQDRHDRDFCLSPTQEEVVTELFRRDVQSYKQLPLNLYQIQTKFRDEIRPRFGLMRGREFTMKDGYSFHADDECFQRTYQDMYDAYGRILNRIGLDFRAVEADSGKIGGANSHEFQVLAESGEDIIVYASDGPYAANLERAIAAGPGPRPAPAAELNKVPTPGVKTIDQVAKLLDLPATQCIKTLLVNGTDGPMALILRGDHQLNDIKAEKLPGVSEPLRMASEADVLAATGAPVGSVGPVGLTIPYLVDVEAAALADFVCGANEAEQHLTGVNWERDLPLEAEQIVDMRNVAEGDPAPDGQGELRFLRGIEVGHIFQLGTVYSEPMQAQVLGPDSNNVTPIMGCYGMGVTRLIAAIIEQKHDADGIVWPEPVAPFQLHLLALNYSKSATVRQAADQLYADAQALGVEVLLDDRDDRPGAKFADADLLGIPHRVVVGDRGLKDGQVEYRQRADADSELRALDSILEIFK